MTLKETFFKLLAAYPRHCKACVLQSAVIAIKDPELRIIQPGHLVDNHFKVFFTEN